MAKADPILQQSPQAAAIDLALAYRALFSYWRAVDRAKDHGADVRDMPSALPWDQISSRYRNLIEDWLPETANSAMDAIALVDFVTVLLHDEALGDYFQSGMLLAPETERMHMLKALEVLSGWTNKIGIAEMVAARRAAAAG